MLARIRKAQENESGFTLIELLVVIIIIGILAAIAIPVFLNQRKKGYDAQAKSDLRNLATLEETYMTDASHYTMTTSNLDGFKPSPNAGTITVKVYDAAGTAFAATDALGTGGYCANTTADSGVLWVYDSTKGGLQAKGTAAC